MTDKRLYPFSLPAISCCNIIADTTCHTTELGLAITGLSGTGHYTLIDAEALDHTRTCPGRTQPGVFRNHIHRNLIDLPIVGFPTNLRIRLPRYRCTNPECARKIFQAELSCADCGKQVTHRVTRWILQRLAIDRMSIQATAKALGLGWDLTYQLALDMCRDLVYSDPRCLLMRCWGCIGSCLI